ncbi:hypothetical protein Glove_177g112 [Diversispora epigaea]|uniref:Uncharacterized protein n=1 Tax=Diversispora epigaea TaxID=1348612 RepID=A0A397IWR0_9GLOM|nr:hypothetical protein Glove_177g112 [Diversispora epigaea]
MERVWSNENGTIKDEENTFHWYLKSAEGGNSLCQCYPEVCYWNGIGTTKGEKKAFQWYLKSAEGWNGNGQYILDYCYKNGIGTTRDEKKSFHWYLKSVMDRVLLSEWNWNYIRLKWYLKLAEGRNSIGQYILGNCYLKGIGTTKDEIKGWMWISLSAEGGNDHSQQLIEFLHRNELEISMNKNFQNKLKQNTNRKDNSFSLTLSKSFIENLNSVEYSKIKNRNCFICWKTNSCIEICNKYFQDFGRCHISP